VDVITAARLAKARQQRALIETITGTEATTNTTEVPRPVRGFDGGARPMQLHAPETHDELIVRLVLSSRAYRRT
jgi:hypothetical protein